MAQNNLNTVETVIFIGNGFDIACGYKTSYADFINSTFGEELIKSNYTYNILYEHIKRKYDAARWVDIEVEIGNYSNDITSNAGDKNMVGDEFNENYQALARRLSAYLYLVADKIIPNSVEMDNFTKSWFDAPAYVVNFNYTNICKRVFKNRPNCIEVKHIHGLIPDIEYSNTPSIVLGVDETFDLKNENHKFIIKSRNQHCQMAGVNDALNSATKYIFYGISLGVTDQIFFSNVFLQKNKEFIIYTLDGEEGKFYDRIENLAQSTLAEFKLQNTLEFRPAFRG